MSPESEPPMTTETTARTRKRVDAEMRRAQILDEAIRIIGQRGYHGFSIQELAQRCGLTNAGLLYYFSSKDQLLIAVLEDRDRRDKEAVPSIAGLTEQDRSRTELPLATILGVFRAIVERNTTQPELVRLHTVLRSEALDTDHPAHDYFRRREAAILDAFTHMVAPHAPNPRSTARQIVAVIGGLEQQWLGAGQAFNLVAECDRAIAMLLAQPRA
jgi:AcrR family transcriptional regulator